MTVVESINNSAAKGDIKGIRIMMKNSLLVDPTFTEFSEMETLTQSVSRLYDSHDGKVFETDKDTWDDNYMDKLMVEVVSNFSNERLDHLKAVVRHLRPVTTHSQSQSTRSQVSLSTQKGNDQKTRTQQAQNTNYQEQKRKDKRNGNYRRKKITTGAAIGGVVGGAVASATGGTVIMGAVVGAVIVGTAVAIATNGEKNNE